jgi:hypothetical protein
MVAERITPHALAARTVTSLADAGATIAEIRDVTGHTKGSANILQGRCK